MADKTRLTLRFNAETIKKIKKLAIELGVTPSELMRQSFENFQKKNK